MTPKTTLTAMTSAIALAVAAFGMAGAAYAEDTIKIAYIDPLSGPFANVGDAGAKHFSYFIDYFNANGGFNGKKLELIAIDNKSSPKDSLVALKSAIDQGAHFITQGNGSHVGAALSEAVAKHNERNPDNRVLYLNYAAVDPTLTNDACNFWHFRFDANSDMKLEAITNYIKDQPGIKKVYLLNQDYSHGQSVSKVARKLLNEKRPDIEIVGDDLHPIGKVKDFSPYISKIKASGADTVITGNWGADLSLLVKASASAGLDVQYYTYYGGGLGTPVAIGPAGEGKVKQVTEWHANLPVETPSDQGKVLEDAYVAFLQKYDLDFYYGRIRTMLGMLQEAMNQAKSDEPVAVAKALEGMTYQTAMGPVTMRADDHQLAQPLFISTFVKGVKYDTEHTGLGWKTDAKIDGPATELPTTCKMQRPS